MGELTAAEMRALHAARPVVLLPLGSHEDQGPHCPMGDYLLAEIVAERIARRATEAGTPTLVAPVLPFGKADFFGPMPGGIALSAATFRAVLDEMLAALLRHGLTRVVVLNGHGGNAEAVADATRAVLERSGVTIPCLYLWRIAGAELPRLIGAEAAARRAGHGADPLASIALHLTPERMRPDLTPAPRPGPVPEVLGLPVRGLGAVAFDGAEVTVPQPYDAVLPGGVGPADARLSDAATGAALVERLVALGAGLCAHLAARDAAEAGLGGV